MAGVLGAVTVSLLRLGGLRGERGVEAYLGGIQVGEVLNDEVVDFGQGRPPRPAPRGGMAMEVMSRERIAWVRV